MPAPAATREYLADRADFLGAIRPATGRRYPWFSDCKVSV
jgi:hypothetical protein